MNQEIYEYEHLALVELMAQWNHFNRHLFGRSLKAPTMQCHEGSSRLGYWDKQKRLISFSRQLLQEEAWFKILVVLKHEMLHQFIDESMGLDSTQPHGPVFQAMSQKFSIESHEEVGLSGESSAPQANTLILDKIRKLLSLAQSSNLNEAETAMNKANELMLKWNLDHSALAEKQQLVYLHLGETGRVSLAQKMLANILGTFFFIEAIWVMSYSVKKAKWGRVLEICGLKENVEIADYIYSYLLNVAESHWKNYKKQNPKAHRGNYIYGLLLGFYEKLDEERRKCQEHGLIWLGDPLLDQYFRKRHPRTRSMRSSSMALKKESLDAGKEQGRKVVINRGVKNAQQGQKLLQ
ncbi:MAG: DUF2786 domain-containing protein [Planctomycetes bacterium]|nr:DUF2786 domain-containing protein [Planctomycetota bacterium]